MNADPATVAEAGETRPWYAAHELYTCLNAVRGASELMLAGATGPLGAEALGAVTTILEAARDLERHLRRCQAIDRLRARPRPVLRPVPLATLLTRFEVEGPRSVRVRVAAQEIRAALDLLCPPDGAPGWRIRLSARPRTVTVLVSCPGRTEGEAGGGILYTLVALHLRRGGGRLLPASESDIRFLLRRAPEGPVETGGDRGEGSSSPANEAGRPSRSSTVGGK